MAYSTHTKTAIYLQDLSHPVDKVYGRTVRMYTYAVSHSHYIISHQQPKPTTIIMIVSYDDSMRWQQYCNVSRTSSSQKSTEFLSRFKLNFRLKHNSTSGRMIYFMCQSTNLQMWPTKTMYMFLHGLVFNISEMK